MKTQLVGGLLHETTRPAHHPIVPHGKTGKNGGTAKYNGNGGKTKTFSPTTLLDTTKQLANVLNARLGGLPGSMRVATGQAIILRLANANEPSTSPMDYSYCLLSVLPLEEQCTS